MEEQTHVIKLQDIRLATKPGRIVDANAILDKRGIAAEIAGRLGIDRYIKERAVSAARRVQRHSEHRTTFLLEVAAKFLGETSLHRALPPASFRSHKLQGFRRVRVQE
jgi:hypothetical protein